MTTVRPAEVVTFGECMILFRAEQAGPLAGATRFSRSIAGADSNVAIGLSRLGLSVAWYSRVGNDLFGQQVRSALAEAGVAHIHLGVDCRRPTGFQLKARRDDGGDPETAYFRQGSAASVLSTTDLDLAALARARHLHVTGIAAALGPEAEALCHSAMHAMRAAGGSISFDPNLRPELWPDQACMIRAVEALAGHADWVLCGADEAERLMGSRIPQAIQAHYLARGATEVIVTTGADGAHWATATERAHVPARRMSQIVDTVGAGDGFAAGYISARLEGLSPAKATARGNAVGARVCGHGGDHEGLPDRPTLGLSPLVSTGRPCPGMAG